MNVNSKTQVQEWAEASARKTPGSLRQTFLAAFLASFLGAVLAGVLAAVLAGVLLLLAPPVFADAPDTTKVALAQTPAVAKATQEARSPESIFQDGVAAFKKANDSAARAAFQQSLLLDPTNSFTLFNLGLVEHKAGNRGLALGLWRKALAMHPNYEQAAQAISWAHSRLERGEIPHEIEFWETFRSAMLVGVSLERYLIFAALLLLCGGWLLLRYFGKRRLALLDESPLPAAPIIPSIVLIAAVAFSTLAAAKAFDQSVERGTITAKSIEARSAPGDQGTALFSLYEGLEVIVRQHRNDWVQVSYPGASTGWIPRRAIFTTRDEAFK